jgi:hypothetical protein
MEQGQYYINCDLKIDVIFANNKTCAPKFVSLDEKKVEKIWMVFDVEN